ncbi:uncharacterized protein LOC124545980 [Schistocerca americana]|uniref:uncharacterized protein LOC124545980 n=1 Tax=Schistocerca americana TaxID=7009 RepID=UPI001F4F18A2|nr:uncharacterized protein LOC124545980 [Schistocerca americana]
MRLGLLWAAALLSVVSAKAQYPDGFPVSTRVRRDVNMQHGCNKCLYFPGRLRVCIYFPCTPPHADVKNCVWCKQFGPHKVCVQYTCLTNINGGKECTPGSSYLHRCNICTCGKKPNDEESTCSNNFCRGDVPAYPEG